MVDRATEEFFRCQLQDPANAVCCDSGTQDPQWASISHGTYISIGTSGIHRSLGVKVSFVQSLTMDAWKPLHKRMMELGGNRRFLDYMRAQNVPEDMPIREKYSTKAAEWYRRYLRALAEERELPEPLPEGTGHLPATDSAALTTAVLDRVYADVPAREDNQTSPTSSPRSHASSRKRSPRLEAMNDELVHKQSVSSSSGKADLDATRLAVPKDCLGSQFLAFEEYDQVVLDYGYDLDCRGVCRFIKHYILLQDHKEPASPAVALRRGRSDRSEYDSESLLTCAKMSLKKVAEGAAPVRGQQ
mmetsp:Transcript_1891/g.4823  ORF Transcript_1891/g.4823 Transcript_1891/m.4823 type:complete len:302 (-) Transcript_1891:250-1155(-)